MGSRTIHIAQIVGKLAAAGVEAVVNNYFQYMDHNRIQFDYFVDNDSEFLPPQEMKVLGARYFYIPSSKYPFRRIKALTKIFKQERPQIVHSHMNSLNALSLYAAWKARIPVRISHCHSTSNKHEGCRAIIKWFLKKTGNWFATEKMACGEKAGRWLFGERAMKLGEVFILPNAIAVEHFRFNSETRERLRKELSIQDKFVIGHVGRFVRQKNHAFLIDVFAEVKKKRNDAVLLLIGDGELREKIKKTAWQKGLSDSVLFLGVRKDVSDFYNIMDVFALPSLYEGVPVVGIEAQANGLRCIFSKHVARESAFLSDCSFLGLNSRKPWVEELLTISKKRKQTREVENQIMIDSAMNISVSGKRLENYYVSRSQISINYEDQLNM